MDKETLSNYGWVVICVLVLAVMIALATPFGNFIATAVRSTTAGFFNVEKTALNNTGLIVIEDQEFDVPNIDAGAENTKETITFTLQDSTNPEYANINLQLTAEKDMTWGEWLESKYNTVNAYWREDNWNIYMHIPGEEYEYYFIGRESIELDGVIIENQVYVISCR